MPPAPTAIPAAVPAAILAAGLALTAGACTAPDRTAGSGPAQVPGSGPAQASSATQATAEGAAGETPWVYGDVRPGRGLLGNDEDGYVLLRGGEAAPDPGKPAKVRR